VAKVCPRRVHGDGHQRAAIGATITFMLVAELLDELAHAIPNLHDAACRATPELFDIADRHDYQGISRAKAVCQSCPALQDCRDWLTSLPRPMRPSGVVAGRYLGPPPLPPPYVPVPRPPSAPDRAIVWLRAYLGEHGGAVLGGQVIADGAVAGISASTLRHARIALGVRLERVPGVGARHLWRAA
jgi:Transcription factor WhiB